MPEPHVSIIIMISCRLCCWSAERKPLPREPDVGEQPGVSHGGRLLDAQNEAATQAYNTEALDSCENCGRTFLPDRWANVVIFKFQCQLGDQSPPSELVSGFFRALVSCLGQYYPSAITSPIDIPTAKIPPPNPPHCPCRPITFLFWPD